MRNCYFFSIANAIAGVFITANYALLLGFVSTRKESKRIDKENIKLLLNTLRKVISELNNIRRLLFQDECYIDHFWNN